MLGYIYIVTNNINGKVYIGKKTSKIFLETYLGSGSLIKAAVSYYGKNNFSVQILEEINDLSILDEREIF